MYYKKRKKKQFHAWNEFRIIYHYRIKEKTHFNGDLYDVILLSTTELKNRKAKRGTLSYLFFKDKFNVLCIELYTKEKIGRNVGKFDTIWYEREEFLETLGQWGIKIESDCEDLNKYYIPKQEEKTIELMDGIGIKKLQENQWKIVTTLFEHIIQYDDNIKELFIDGIRRRFSEKAYVRFIGIDEGIEIDGKKIRIVVRNKKMRIVYKGKYVDIDEPYIPLKVERIIYCVIPFPVILASIGALNDIKELFPISFFLLIALYTYVSKAITVNKTEQ